MEVDLWAVDPRWAGVSIATRLVAGGEEHWWCSAHHLWVREEGRWRSAWLFANEVGTLAAEAGLGGGALPEPCDAGVPAVRCFWALLDDDDGWRRADPSREPTEPLP